MGRCTKLCGGDEELTGDADTDSLGKPEIVWENLSSRELIDRWRSGAQQAAEVLLARYEARLVALVAARLRSRHQGRIEPPDVVQSAMASFFQRVRADGRPALQLQSSVSAWNLLATFARRKLSRAIEREDTAKRGASWRRATWDADLAAKLVQHPASALEADECIAKLESQLDAPQFALLPLLLENRTQREMAEILAVDERTIRRRLAAIRKCFVETGSDEFSSRPSAMEENPAVVTLPEIRYSEFVLGKRVGYGGFGKVYRAKMQADERLVAVKFMHRRLWDDARSRLSFLREIEHASRIDHHGVMKYLGWGVSPQGGPYLVAEYIDGQPLASARRDDRRAVDWLIQVCDAVQSAHELGVVHGDLTPQNILVTPDGRVVIADFGLATSMHRWSDSREQRPELRLMGGTIGFAAPEQIASAFGAIGPATDIYAIGGLAFYLLSGQPPHGTSDESIANTLSDDDESIAITPSTTSPAEERLWLVASAALKKAIVERPGSARELADLLANRP